METPIKIDRIQPPAIEPGDGTRVFKITVSTTIEYTVEGKDEDDAYNKLHIEDTYLHKKYLNETTESIEEVRGNV